jgi:hypothetical protein
MKRNKKNAKAQYTRPVLAKLANLVRQFGTEAHRLKAHSRYYLVNWYIRAQKGDAQFAYLLQAEAPAITVKLTPKEQGIMQKVQGIGTSFSLEDLVEPVGNDNLKSTRGIVQSLVKKGVLKHVGETYQLA